MNEEFTIQVGDRVELSTEQKWLAVLHARHGGAFDSAKSAMPPGSRGTVYMYHDRDGWSALAIRFDGMKLPDGDACLIGYELALPIPGNYYFKQASAAHWTAWLKVIGHQEEVT